MDQFDLIKDSVDKLNGSVDKFKKYNTITQRYSEPWRYYHNLFHLKDVINSISILLNKYDFDLSKKDIAVLYLAAAYHDIVYDPHLNINEKRSSEVMVQELSKCGIDNKYLSFISYSILDTKHISKTNNVLSKILLDADLAIFAKDKYSFDEYEKNIRLEYYHVPDDVYFSSRKEIMLSFLKNDIYHTEIGYQLWNDLALDNLKKYSI